MKIARKPTKPEMAELVDFIFNEEMEDIGLFAWWVPVLSDLASILTRLRAIWTVKKATITVFDGCVMKTYGYVGRVMIVRWRPGQIRNKAQDTFIWVQNHLEKMPRGRKQRMYHDLNQLVRMGKTSFANTSSRIDELLYGENGAWRGQAE